jgi:hypothetical protein
MLYVYLACRTNGTTVQLVSKQGIQWDAEECLGQETSAIRRGFDGTRMNADVFCFTTMEWFWAEAFL